MNISPFDLAGAYWNQLPPESRGEIFKKCFYPLLQVKAHVTTTFWHLPAHMQYDIAREILLGSRTDYIAMMEAATCETN